MRGMISRNGIRSVDEGFPVRHSCEDFCQNIYPIYLYLDCKFVISVGI